MGYTESQSFGHRGGDEEPTRAPVPERCEGYSNVGQGEHVQASFSAHSAREGEAPTAYAGGGGDASPGNCGDNEEGRMKATRYYLFLICFLFLAPQCLAWENPCHNANQPPKPFPRETRSTYTLEARRVISVEGAIMLYDLGGEAGHQGRGAWTPLLSQRDKERPLYCEGGRQHRT